MIWEFVFIITVVFIFKSHYFIPPCVYARFIRYELFDCFHPSTPLQVLFLKIIHHTSSSFMGTRFIPTPFLFFFFLVSFSSSHFISLFLFFFLFSCAHYHHRFMYIHPSSLLSNFFFFLTLFFTFSLGSFASDSDSDSSFDEVLSIYQSIIFRTFSLLSGFCYRTEPVRSVVGG